MSEVLREGKAVLSSTLSVPVPVLVAGVSIIAIRCVGVALQVHELGINELLRFVHRSAQAWDSTLIFIASQLLFFIQLRCALAVMHGRNWARWGYALAQLVVMFYLSVASMGWIYPELFNISGSGQGMLLPRLISAMLPDLLVLCLLFIPASSREFFRHP
ncbi:YbjO family protein [Erwinia papayae]|uniref:YbjO family protein n=1 Tax=Erwinia papayae TaxID=206499 RepID=A0ABV3MWF5_9GAMM